MTKELRQWAIEQAIHAKAKDVVSAADSYLDFVLLDDKSRTKAMQKEQEERGEVMEDWSPRKLTEAKERVMMNVISRYNRKLPVNGVQVASDLKLTQSCVSSHLAELVAWGYVGRSGNKFYPLRTLTGKLMPVVVTKMPEGIAKGYTGQLKAPLGDIATIKKKGN